MNRTIFVSEIEPQPLSIRHALGCDFYLNVTWVGRNGNPIDPALNRPQFVLLPRSQGGVAAYDMETFDAANGISAVAIPGAGLTDRSGYNIEIYWRWEPETPGDPPRAGGLLATGAMVMQGSAYQSPGPFSMINVPVVTGPPGPAGETGRRGSIWTTGAGAPSVTGNELPGDMYLDEATGDVYRFDGAAWTRGTF